MRVSALGAYGLERSMLGWMTIIYCSVLESQDDSAASPEVSCVELARWEAGVRSEGWIENLVKEGKAILVASNGGYPTRYTAPAGEVIPRIRNGPPSFNGPTILGDDYIAVGGWKDKIVLNHEKMGNPPRKK